MSGEAGATFRFHHGVDVRFRDLDPMGHAHHSLPLIYLEEARAAYWRSVVGRDGLDAIDYVMAEITVRFHRRIEFPMRLEVALRPGYSEVGSGSLPGESLGTTLVSIRHPTLSAAALSRMLRFGDPAVYTRIVDDLVCVDPRTLLPGDDRLLVRALKEVS